MASQNQNSKIQWSDEIHIAIRQQVSRVVMATASVLVEIIRTKLRVAVSAATLFAETERLSKTDRLEQMGDRKSLTLIWYLHTLAMVPIQ